MTDYLSESCRRAQSNILATGFDERHMLLRKPGAIRHLGLSQASPDTCGSQIFAELIPHIAGITSNTEVAVSAVYSPVRTADRRHLLVSFFVHMQW